MSDNFDASRITTIQELEKAELEHKSNVYKKLKFQGQIIQAKKEAAAGFREQLQVIKEELEAEVAIVDSILDRKKFIS